MIINDSHIAIPKEDSFKEHIIIIIIIIIII
jgi:hypothetical protein